MRVTVHFVDGEQLTGDAGQVALDRGGFTLTNPGGNTKSVWVGAAAVKYIVTHPGTAGAGAEADPRGKDDLGKVVLHFLDGELLYSYQDSVFAEEPGGFIVQLWDPDRGELVRALVSGAALKGVFFVDRWDGRAEPDAGPGTTTDEATIAWIDQAVAAAEATSDEGVDGVPAGPILVEEPVLIEGPIAVDAQPAVEEPAIEGDVLEVEAAVQQSLVDPGDAQDDPFLAVVVSEPEERRPSFRSALTPRRMVVATLPTPEEQRYNQLRARIAEVLGRAGPPEPEDPDTESPDSEEAG